MKSMKSRLLALLFTILLMSTSWSQTKTFGSKVKIKNIPEVTNIDTLVTASSEGVLNSVKYTSLFTKMLTDLQKNGSLGGGSISSINDISDVTISAPAGNQALMYNGTNWVNSAISIPSTQISDFNSAVSNIVPVVNNVNSTSTTSALSAYMGNFVSARVDDFENDISLIQSKVDSWDANTNNIIDDSEKLNNQSASYYLDYNNLTNKPVQNYKGLFDLSTVSFGSWATNDFAFLTDVKGFALKNQNNTIDFAYTSKHQFPVAVGNYFYSNNGWVGFETVVVDNLTSDDANLSLSARQGKILQTNINTIGTLYNTLSNQKLEKNPNDGNLYIRSNDSWVNATQHLIQSPDFVTTTSSVISLGNKGGTFYHASNNAASYTVSPNAIGGVAYVIIDSSGMTAYPTIAGATLIESPAFVAGTHRMTVFNEGGTIKYFFTKE